MTAATRLPGDGQIAARSQREPIPNPDIIRIYEEVLPESADGILSMVERKQDYEKRARRTECWLNLATWVAILAGIAAIVVTVYPLDVDTIVGA